MIPTNILTPYNVIRNSHHLDSACDELVCNLCMYKTRYKSQMKIHEESKKHQNKINNVEKEILYCNPCNFKTKFMSKMKEHEETIKHKIVTVGYVKPEKEYLVCEACEYKTKYASQMKIHQESKKHQRLINTHIENSVVVK